ncbi:MAG TPA: Flp family type IVb pilin [Acidobacteriaceae bacterium]|nr:Flp family type IVb pilin [Acidobacteriaceae bacterium]
MNNLLCKLYTDDSGQDLIEYALIAALIALLALAALSSVGTQISGVLGDVATSL